MKRENLLNPASDAELERRQVAVRAAMVDADLDLLIIQNSSEHLGGYVRWITDMPATNGYPRTVLVPAQGGLSIVEQGAFGITQELNDHPVHRGVDRRLFAPSYCSAHFTGKYDADRVIEEIDRLKPRKVGLVGTAGMFFQFGQCVSKHLTNKGVKIVEFSEAIDQIKVPKSAEEIEMIKKTASMQDEIWAKLIPQIRPGMHDFEVTALAQYIGHQLGSEQGTFNGHSVPFGEMSSASSHRHEQARKFSYGEHMMLLTENNGPGAQFTELSRMIVLGNANAELNKIHDLALESQSFIVDQLEVGKPFADISEAYNEFLSRKNMPPELRLVGHGQGYDMVERPLIRRDETMVVEPGMNLAIHPTFATGTLFYMLCDNFLIDLDGSIGRLHKTPQTLVEIDCLRQLSSGLA